MRPATTLLAIVAAAAVLAAGAAAADSAAVGADRDGLLAAMKKEIARSVDSLGRGELPLLYYLGYEVHDRINYSISASLGALVSEGEGRQRTLTVDARVGDRAFDNTHQIKGPSGSWEWQMPSSTRLSMEDDGAALRSAMWLATDEAVKNARQRYTKVKTNKAMTADEEDKSDDFSREISERFYERRDPPRIDRDAWRDRLRRLSSLLKARPSVLHSSVTLDTVALHRYVVTSEGAEVVTGNLYLRIGYSLEGRTEDGMDLVRYQAYDADRIEDLPDEQRIARDIERSATELQALVGAPLVEPYVGPAIFRAKAVGVYFHEIMGHRLEGHRQKNEAEGQTFTRMLGKPVTAPFISVYDDATLRSWRGLQFLRGYYAFDDEGVRPRRVALVEKGILKGFMMSRSPVKGFATSNGHGRRSPGNPVVARMGNTIVEAAQTVPYTRLREMLIEEVRRQEKPYGLVFDDIAGGYTVTRRGGTQAFKVIPLLVYRVYPDGRPDETVRGVDIVGTPLQSFTKILAAADDYDVFNGSCGAESGMVPVSAVAPSLLFSEIEVEKKTKSSAKPPALPAPLNDPAGGGGTGP